MTDKIVELDPATATTAQLQEMEADLDRAGQLIARLRAEWQREEREEVEAEKRFNLMVAAAERIHAQINDPNIAAEKKVSLNNSLAAMLPELENLKVELDRERQEADDAQQLLNEAEAAYQEKGAALKQAKKKLESASRELERAKIRKTAAEQRAEQAAAVAGLRQDGGGSNLNAALVAMERQAAALNGEAEADRLKASVLAKPQLGDSSDPNIADALRAVQSGAGLTDQSVGDRLAALTGRAPQQVLSAPTPAAEESRPHGS